MYFELVQNVVLFLLAISLLTTVLWILNDI